MRILDDAPPAGEGLNKWVIRAATALKGYASHDTAFNLLLTRMVAQGRPAGEAAREVSRALNASWDDSRPTPTSSIKIGADDLAVDRAVIHGNDKESAYSRLIASSPIRTQPEMDTRRTARILTVLFPGDPYLCFGYGDRTHDCMTLSDWLATKRTCGWEFIVPCEQKARTGLTAEGKESTHALSNCGERRYLVAEFDFPEHRWSEYGISRRDGQSALILALAKLFTLVMVVDSKSKSLHAWFDVKRKSEAEVADVFAAFSRMGACPTTFTKSQFVRMPDGTRSRNKGRGLRQSVLFLDLLTPNKPQP
jgi:hypothetical protein